MTVEIPILLVNVVLGIFVITLYISLNCAIANAMLQTMDINKFEEMIGGRIILFCLIGLPVILYYFLKRQINRNR